MEARSEARIGAYLLGKLPERERDELEARMLEEPLLHAAVRRAEAAIFRGFFPSKRRVVAYCAACFALGVALGAALALAVESFS